MRNFGQMLARAIKQAAKALKQSALRASTALVSVVEMVYEGGEWVAKTVLRAMPTFGGGGGGSAADPADVAEAAMDRLLDQDQPAAAKGDQSDTKKALKDPEAMDIFKQAKALKILAGCKLRGQAVPEGKLERMPSGIKQIYGAMSDDHATAIASMPDAKVALWLRGEPGLGLPSPQDVVQPPRPLFDRARLERNMEAIAEAKQAASNVVPIRRAA